MNGKDLLKQMGSLSPKYYEEAEQPLVSSRRGWKKPLVIAATLALATILMGSAIAYVVNLQQLEVGQQTISRHTQYMADGSTIPPTEAVRGLYSLQGLTQTKAAQATKEWLDYKESRPVSPEAPDFQAPEEYVSYGLWSDADQKKLEEILEKYDLEPAGACAIIQGPARERFFQAVGLDTLARKGTTAKVELDGGHLHQSGSFNMMHRVYLPETLWDKEIRVYFTYNPKTCFSPYHIGLEEPEAMEQWNYKTASGEEVLIVNDGETARLLLDREDAFLAVSFDIYDFNAREGDAPMGKQSIEAVADAMNFTIAPKVTVDVSALAKELDALYQADTWSEEEQAAAQKQYEEFMAHASQGSYADLVADIIQNEDVYAANCNVCYQGFAADGEFCLMDITGDGEDELLLGREGSVMDVWTLAEGKTQRTGFGSPWEGYILEGFVFETAAVERGNQFHVYQPTSEQSILKEQIQLTYDSASGLWQMMEGDTWKKVTETEAFDLMDSFKRIPVEMKPLPQFPKA